MCRLYGFRANEPTKVECTLVYAQNALLTQSRADRRGEAHPDGWGLASYENGVPTVERRATAAFRDVHFSTTAERVFARTVVAHVRQATVGGATLENTHPFVSGRWTFAHNGTVRGFERVRPRMEREIPEMLLSERRGSTDSELVFYWLLARMVAAGVSLDGASVDLALVVDVLGRSVRTLDRWCQAADEEPAKLNFLLTDGCVLVATRWRNSLYHVSRQGIHDCEICGIPHVQHGKAVPYRAVVIASEPISDEPWQEVPDETVLSVDASNAVSLSPM